MTKIGKRDEKEIKKERERFDIEDVDIRSIL